MADRSIDELNAGAEAATPAEPFLMSKTELITHIEANNATGCGSYATEGDTNGRTDWARDYACQD